ncbi:hypothetical protein WJX73_009635 [Symbiochloris irregularis]|uniref:Uncharacterized protein n=1 Tax=Symbiochloris irregularis TaxID=706552 RepID=A0AAW1PZC6_9CHLO
MGVQGARGVANKAHEKMERDRIQKGAWTNRRYVDWAGRELSLELTGYDGNITPELANQLTIPEMQFDGRSPAACYLTNQQVSELDRAILDAQTLLGQAAVTINKAESKAGFAANAGTIAMGGVRGQPSMAHCTLPGKRTEA